MVSDGLIEVHDTIVVKAAMKERRAEPKHTHAKQQGKAKLMRIYLGEADQWQSEPLYEAIVKQLRMLEISGATVHRGILGYGAKGHAHKQSFWHLSRDLPIMIAVIDTEEKLNQAVDVLGSMLQDGLIVVSDVDVIRFVHSHSLAEVPNASGPAS
jgi:PII-like signaling protein